MGNATDSLRRKLGIVCLAVPVGMLVLGQTALKSSLDGAAFLFYWAICFLFTLAAMFIALADIRSVRRQSRHETRELIEKTWAEIQRKRDEESSNPDHG